MSHSQQDEQDDLQKYLEEKAKQAQVKESQPLSAHDACVLKESDKIRELIEGEAQKEGKK